MPGLIVSRAYIMAGKCSGTVYRLVHVPVFIYQFAIGDASSVDFGDLT